MADTTVDELVARYLDLEQRKASIVEEQDVIKAQLRRTLDVGKHQVDTGTVTLAVNRRFDPTIAEQVLATNPDLIKACSSTKIDPAKAKKILPPAVYESCMKESGDPRVSIS